MSLSISGISTVQPTLAPLAISLSLHTAPARLATPAALPSAYVVTLSQAAQVSQMSAQGESASTIAQSLGVSISMVNLDLGIVAQAASIPVAAPPVHTAAPPAASGTPIPKISAA